MPDNLNIRRPDDNKRININQPWEISYWCKKFGCSEIELKRAVAAVGDSAEKVEKYLKNNRH